MAKTKVTTVVHSTKDENGDWQETAKSVTTTTEIDQDGYPHTFTRPRFTPKNPYSSPYNYFGSFEGFQIRPVRKDDKDV